ncbi:TPA_asm: M [Betula betacytorhabdovirus 2]|nr:TPA_asm: M [Betula betacytorhabdovirus 2]
MSYKIVSTPVNRLSVYYGVCVGNIKITIEGSQKDIMLDKWRGMIKVTVLQQAKDLNMSHEDSMMLAEFLFWYLSEISILYPPSFVENDDILFGPDSYLFTYEPPTYRMFKCKDRLQKDLSINLKAHNIIQSPDGVMISRVTLQGLINLGPLTEVKATEVFHKDKSLMLVGTFIYKVKSLEMEHSPDRSKKNKK